MFTRKPTRGCGGCLASCPTVRMGDRIRERQHYSTPERAAETLLPQLSVQSRLIVTGQIGCGKTTLANVLCTRLGLTHLEIDRFNDDPEPHLAATDAARAIVGGWVAEANVWQIPQAIWELSDFGIFLDYANIVHYPRIIQRCFGKCIRERSWAKIQQNMRDEFLHLRIVYRYANANRKGWQENGGITNTATPVIRSTSPGMTERLLAHIPVALALREEYKNRP